MTEVFSRLPIAGLASDGIAVQPAPVRTSRRIRYLDEQSERARRFHCLRLGRRYENCSLENFELSVDPAVRHLQEAALSQVRKYSATMRDRVSDGQGLILFGPAGTGKDHFMTALMRTAIFDHGFTVAWVSCADLYGRVRDRMETSQSEEELIRELAAPDILALSDPVPPWGPLTSFQSQFMYRLIDRRYHDCKAVWLTLNVANGNEADERIGAVVVDRLRDKSITIQMSWPSFRTAQQL